MLRLVFFGSGRWEGEGRVGCEEPRAVMLGVDGLRGVGGGKSCGREAYQVKMMWPNLEGVEEAPATAKRGEDMNVRAARAMGVDVVGGLGGMVARMDGRVWWSV